MRIFAIVGLLCLSLIAPRTVALENGLALTPFMGWNSWNHWRCAMNESIIRATADVMKWSGMSAVGYKYVSLDDCWVLPKRDSNNRPVADPNKFPSGIKALADYIHSLGLLFGIYSDAGSATCIYPGVGSLGYEQIDADTYAEWTADLLKYDDCNDENLPYVPRYKSMRDAIANTKRPMVYSMCAARYNLWQPIWSRALGNSWRTTTDIGAFWKSITNNLDGNNRWWQWAGRGGWNDADMLQVGNGDLSYDESVSHFSLWCAIKSPLIAGNDLTSMIEETRSILTNQELIAVNQDSLGRQANLVYNVSDAQVWAGPLADGAVVAILLNRLDYGNLSITVSWSDIGIPVDVPALVRDMWLHQDLINATGSFTVNNIRPHASISLRITASGPMHQPSLEVE